MAIQKITKEFDRPGPLLKDTVVLMQKPGITLESLALATGLPFHWLRKVRSGEIKNPSVNRVEHLYKHLKRTA